MGWACGLGGVLGLFFCSLFLLGLGGCVECFTNERIYWL